MKKKRYRYIVFDLGNTLIRFDHSRSAGKLANLFKLDAKKIYDMFFDSKLTRDFECGLISPKEFYDKASAMLGITMPYDEFVAIWNDIFWADEAMCDLARQLKSSYTLFLLSNINRLHFEHIREKFDIIEIFDELVLSYAVGAIKPDHKIFNDVIRRAGGKKEEILYIDDRDDLIREAMMLGIDSIRFENVDLLKSVMRDKGVLVDLP